MARVWSNSSREPSVVTVGAESVCVGEARSVQSAGIKDLLPSGKISVRSNRLFTLDCSENAERFAFERMARADNSHSFGEVLMMTSMS
jgi:hypothetical protein